MNTLRRCPTVLFPVTENIPWALRSISDSAPFQFSTWGVERTNLKNWFLFRVGFEIPAFTSINLLMPLYVLSLKCHHCLHLLSVSQQCLARPGHGLLGACALLSLVSCAPLIVFTPPPPPPPWSSTLDDHAGPLQGAQRRFHLSRSGEVIVLLLVMLNVTTNLCAPVLWCSELSFPSTGFENHAKIMGSGLQWSKSLEMKLRLSVKTMVSRMSLPWVAADEGVDRRRIIC